MNSTSCAHCGSRGPGGRTTESLTFLSLRAELFGRGQLARAVGLPQLWLPFPFRQHMLTLHRRSHRRRGRLPLVVRVGFLGLNGDLVAAPQREVNLLGLFEDLARGTQRL